VRVYVVVDFLKQLGQGLFQRLFIGLVEVDMRGVHHENLMINLLKQMMKFG